MADKLFWSGQTERGHALMRKAAALNPNHPGWYNIVPSAYHYLKGDYDNALKYALEIQMPEFFWNQAHLAANYAQLGRSEEAQASSEKLLELYPSFEKDYRGLFKAFNVPDRTIEAYVDGFRKAGLDIPDRLN